MSRSDDEDMEEALSGDEADTSGEEEEEDGSSDEEVNEDELELDEVELEPRILPGRAARVQLGQVTFLERMPSILLRSALLGETRAYNFTRSCLLQQ